MRCVEFREYRKSTTTTNNSKMTRVFDLLWCELKIVPQSGSLIGLPFSVQPSFARRAGTFSRACARIFDSLRDVTPTAVRRQMGSTQLGGRDAQRGALDDVRASADRPKLGRDADEVRVVRVAEKVQRHNSWRLSVLCVIMAARESALHC